MKIALVVERFDPQRGGLEQWSYRFAMEAAARGHEMHIISARFGPQLRELPLVLHTLPGANSRLGFAAAAENYLRRLPVDVVHDTGAGWHCQVFQPHCGSRIAALEQDLLMAPRWMQPLRRHVGQWLPRYRDFQALMQRQYVDDGRLYVAISRLVADDFRRYHGVPERQIRLVYNGVDTERFSPAGQIEHRTATRRRLGLDPQTVLLLIVAHNFRLKGVPALLETVARLRAQQQPVHLAVVGGKRLGRYLRLAQRLGAAGHVTFVGPCDDPRPYYAAADIYVHPTRYDPCSLVLLEALASGLPVVTTRRNGVAELIRDGREGFLIDEPSDVEAMVARLTQLVEVPFRARMAEAARQLALQHPFARNVDEILAVHQEWLASRQARAA